MLMKKQLIMITNQIVMSKLGNQDTSDLKK